MKKTLLAIVLIATILGIKNPVQAQSSVTKKKKDNSAVNADRDAIKKLIFTYQDALNASDVDNVISLYTTNGVLLANAAPTAEGKDQVKGTYQYVFNNFTYTLKFEVLEVQVNGDMAFARSTSKGSFVIKSSGQTISDENRELFVFEKVSGHWKIARYMYNKTK